MEPAKSQNRLLEIDVLRAIAIVSVITIHVNAFAVSVSHAQILKNYIALDQLLRFCVPLFVALSGYSLALRYKDETVDFWEFLKKRTFRLLPWYVFWSTVILIYDKVFLSNFNLILLIQTFLLGQADYHLYFVPMIFVLYLLFPPLLFVYKKLNWKFLALVFLAEIAFYHYLNSQSLKLLMSDQQQYVLAPTWLFYFVLGIALAISRIRPLTTLIALTIPFFFYLTFKNCLDLAKHYDLIIATRFTRIPALFYASAVSATAIIFSKKLLILPPKITEILANMGKRSYVTYLCHTLVLRIATEKIGLTSNLRILVIAIITILAADQLARASIFASQIISGVIVRVKSRTS